MDANALTTAVNEVFDQEQRSFSITAAPGSDPDAARQRVSRPPSVISSNIDQQSKSVLTTAIPMTTFAEAGRLSRVLAGRDSANGLGYAYVLTTSLADARRPATTV